MAEILQSPLRLRLRASSFSCFQTLFVHSQTLFSNPCRHTLANAIPNFVPLRSPNRRFSFRILSKSDSDSDFGLISASEHSDGSILFRFGNVKDYETMVAASREVDQSDDVDTEVLKNVDGEELNERKKTNSEYVISQSKRRRSSRSTRVIRKAKTVVHGDSSVVESTRNGMSESTVSLLQETAINSEEHDDLSCSNSSVDEVSVDVNKGLVATKDATNLEADKVINEAICGNVEEKTASMCENGVAAEAVSSELDSSSDVSENSAARASRKENSDPVVASFVTADTDNGNVSTEAIVSTETLVKVSIDEATGPRTIDVYVDATETEDTTPLGHNPSSTIEEEVGTSTQDVSIVEESTNHGVVECLSIEDTPISEEILTGEFVLSSGAALLRTPSEELINGEDAYFVAENWLGVADGIGHWSLEGISDGIYAREIMKNCERIISHCESTPVNDPRDVLLRSVAETESPGASTILVAHFDGQAFHVANIGDSGFRIIRNGAVFQQSSPVVHEFNFPFHVERGDDPTEHIAAYKVDLDEGDIIVTATDGLFDNLYDHDIVAIVSESLEAGVEPQDTAKLLANKALELGQSSSSRSPFADSAQAAGYTGYSGGKPDDVVVIVTLVQKKPSS